MPKKNIILTKEVSERLESIFKDATYKSSDDKLVHDVLRGFPESIPTFGEPIGTIYVKGAKDFWNSQGRHNVPKNIRSVLAVIINGTGQATYDKAVEINDTLLDSLMNDFKWFTLDKLVRATFIEDNTIYIENKNGLRTTIVFVLTHEVYK